MTMSIYGLGSSDFLSDFHRKVDPDNSSTSLVKLDQDLSNYKSIKCHDCIMAILLHNGSLYTYGSNETLLGHTQETSKVTSLETIVVKSVEVGGTHAFAIDEQKRVYGWGQNERHQLGFIETEDFTKPKLQRRFPNNLSVISIACGYSHSLFLLSNGTIWSSGNNEYGQLGLGVDGGCYDIRQITSITGIPFVQIVAGYNHSLALTMSGTVFGWGKNDRGQLGVGDTKNRLAPNRLSSLRSQKVKYVAAGKHHSVALTADGGVFTFGCNEFGQLGHGFTSGNKGVNPRKVFELMGTNVSQVSCGKNHTLAYVADQTQVYSFGDNSLSQLGYSGNENNQNYVPTLVKGPWSEKTTISFVMRMLLSGGNCSLMHVSHDGQAPLDFRHDAISPKIHYLSQDAVSFFSQSDERKLTDNALRTLEVVTSSQSCLNSSFMASDHDRTNANYSGINMMAARLGFSKLCNSQSQKVESTILQGLVKCIPSLSDNPPDVEALRLYIFLCECPLMQRKENYMTLTYPFAAKIVALQKNPGKILDKWYRALEPMYFIKIVDTFKGLLNELLTKPFAFTQVDSMINVTLEVIKKFYKVNIMEQKLMIPYQKFYMADIARVVNFEGDYLQYVKGTITSKPVFCKYPFLLDSTVKTEILKMDAQYQMRAAYQEAQNRNIASIFGLSGTLALETPRLELEVSRDDIVNNTLNQLSQVDMGSLKKPLMVKFQGEEGEDAGGVRKEFFLLILKEILDVKYGMFKTYEESRLMWFAEIQLETDSMYFLVGLICGLAIYNNTIINIGFPLALYRKLLGDKVGMEDLKELDPMRHKNMQYILDLDEMESGTTVADLCLTFSEDKDNFGETITIDLIPDGANKEVNGTNRLEYVNAYIDYLFNQSVEKQFAAFSEGFHKVCGGHILNLFRPRELMEMVIGNQDYNWEDFERTAEYKGTYYRQHKVIDMFWKVFHTLSLDDKKNFLLFLTGSNKVPINGVKITIQSVGLGDEHLPVAHTCFNLLDLPVYTSETALREKLCMALLYNQGFHLV